MPNDKLLISAATTTAPSWLEALPDLAVQLSRDGTVLRRAGGRLCPLPLELPPSILAQLRQLARRAMTSRATLEGTAAHAEQTYEIRVTAQSPDRAIGTIRPIANDQDSRADMRDFPGHRRHFWPKLTELTSNAVMGERPCALAIIQLDGIEDISRLIDGDTVDQLAGMALSRLARSGCEAEGGSIGQTRRDELAVLFEHIDRSAIERVLDRICQGLRMGLDWGDASFYVKPYVGVAILGQDATSQTALFDSARTAAAEARRCDAAAPHFFSDTLRLRVLTRIDIAEELRDALANRDIKLRYRPRHDFASGRLVALVAYARWQHPIRGEVPAEKFLSAAAATGLATALSQSLWRSVCEEAASVLATVDGDVRVSFGALRHHVIDGNFLREAENALSQHKIDPLRLELRIADRVHATRDPAEWRSLADRGVRLVVDEVGRHSSSLERLAKAPLWGLQLDRATAMSADPSARKLCRAVVGMARGLSLVPIATGVDTPEQRQYLTSIGCEQGSGDDFLITPTSEFASTGRQFSQAT